MTRAIFALPFVLVGCGYTEVHEVLLRPAVPPSQPVEIYVGGQNPQRPFYEVGLLQAVGHGSDANAGDVTKALAARASRAGCDALVRVHVDQGYTMANVVGVCVRWADRVEPSPVREPPPPEPPAPEASPPAPSGTGVQTL